jgi:hypothetical protein
MGARSLDGEALDRLLFELSLWLTAARGCRCKHEFTRFLHELFVSVCEETIGSWRRHWPRIQNEIAEAIERIEERAEEARKDRKVLLVMGV